MKIKYCLVETDSKQKYYMIPLNANLLGKYGIQSLIIEAVMTDKIFKCTFGYWHDGDPERFLHYLYTYNQSLVEACKNKLYMNSSFGFYPGKAKIIKTKHFSFETWSKDIFTLVIQKIKQLNEELK